MTSENAKPLKVAVCGAGIVGLATAAGFRQQGHIVEVFESASFNEEVGAAIGVAENALKVLRYLNFKLENLKGAPFKFKMISYTGEKPPIYIIPTNVQDPNGVGPMGYGVHRVDLHHELRRLAMSPELPGIPAVLHLSSGVESCDPLTGTLKLKNGQLHHADVIVGADGIHSVIRTVVVGHRVDAYSTNPPRAMFRWTMPASAASAEKLAWAGVDNYGTGVQGHQSALIVYPCRDRTVINSAAAHVDKRDQSSVPQSVSATKEQLLAALEDYAPRFKEWLYVAENIKLWQLRMLPPLPTWNKGCACIIGDAAHAMLPFNAQGAAMGLEDAAMLSILFPYGTTVADIPSRLAAHQELRKGRAEMVAKWSKEETSIPVDDEQGVVDRLSKDQRLFMLTYDGIQLAQNYFDQHFSQALANL